jgi:hypothetical protein
MFLFKSSPYISDLALTYDLQMPFFYSIGSQTCSAATVERILSAARFDANCSSAAGQLLIALAFDRRSTMGSSLSLLPYDALFNVFMMVVSILTPLRVLTIANCASRALIKVKDAHLSPRRSSLDLESFFSDFSLVNNVMIRLHRHLPLSALSALLLQCKVLQTLSCVPDGLLQATGFSNSFDCNIQHHSHCSMSCRNTTFFLVGLLADSNPCVPQQLFVLQNMLQCTSNSICHVCAGMLSDTCMFF